GALPGPSSCSSLPHELVGGGDTAVLLGHVLRPVVGLGHDTTLPLEIREAEQHPAAASKLGDDAIARGLVAGAAPSGDRELEHLGQRFHRLTPGALGPAWG